MRISSSCGGGEERVGESCFRGAVIGLSETSESEESSRSRRYFVRGVMMGDAFGEREGVPGWDWAGDDM